MSVDSKSAGIETTKNFVDVADLLSIVIYVRMFSAKLISNSRLSSVNSIISQKRNFLDFLFKRKKRPEYFISPKGFEVPGLKLIPNYLTTKQHDDMLVEIQQIMVSFQLCK